MPEELGELFRTLLQRLEGRTLVSITAKGLEAVFLFDNGDAVTFGKFLYTPEVSSQDAVQQEIEKYLATKQDTFYTRTSLDDNEEG